MPPERRHHSYLDADFRVLGERRTLKNDAQIIEDDAILDAILSGDTVLQTTAGVPWSNGLKRKSTKVNNVENNNEALRDSLFSAIERDELDACAIQFAKVVDLGLTLTDPQLRQAKTGATALYAALEMRSWKAARFLMQSNGDDVMMDGCNITVDGVPSQRTCLHVLADAGEAQLAKHMLQHISTSERREEFLRRGVLTQSEGQRSRHFSALHLAALHGHTAFIEMLVQDFRVDVNSVNNKGDTALMCAARANHIATTRKLLLLGADVRRCNDKGSTPLFWAVRYGYVELTRMLIEEGKADVNQTRKLGLVAPVALAVALGNAALVEVLIKHGANTDLRITNGQTSLHLAAADGCNDVVRLLLGPGSASVNVSDVHGNTALLIAVKNNQLATVKLLLENGANFEERNKAGQSVWDFAMHYPDNQLLIAIAHFYRELHGEASSVQSPVGISRGGSRRGSLTPLHIAASTGDNAKIRCLFDAGMGDTTAQDVNGNTFYHVAARYNCTTVLTAFLDRVDVDKANADGDTATHLAAGGGYQSSVQILLKRANVNIKNNNGQTPLHVAVASDKASSELIQTLVDVIVKANNWSLLNVQNKQGDTALHLAGRRTGYEASDFVRILGALNPAIGNKNGDTALHLAASAGNSETLETILRVFSHPRKLININRPNGAAETILHICGRRGDVQSVKLILDSYGADLSLTNSDGNSLLHVIVQESTLQPSKIHALLEVYRIVLEHAVSWWCAMRHLHRGADDSELYHVQLRDSMAYLTLEIENAKEMNVVQLGVKLGAADFLEEILNTPNVYMFKSTVPKHVEYDVTYLVPETGYQRSKEYVESLGNESHALSSNHVAEATENNLKAAKLNVLDDWSTKERLSCLDIVAGMPDVLKAAKVLDVCPISVLVHGQWNAYRWVYGLLSITHIIFMSCFTYFVLPTARYFYYNHNCARMLSAAAVSVASSNGSTTDNVYADCAKMQTTNNLMGLFIIWPAMVLCFEMYYLATMIASWCKHAHSRWQKHASESKHRQALSTEDFNNAVLNIPSLLVRFFVFNLTYVFATGFSACVIAWFIVYMLGDVDNLESYLELMASVFVLGWAFTISLIGNFEELFSFTIVMKHIFLRDITRFLIMYTFIMLAFGTATHAMMQNVPERAPEVQHVSLWNTLYMFVPLIVGLGNGLDSTVTEWNAIHNGGPGFVQGIHTVYTFVMSIVMFNLVIAMLSTTLTEVQEREGTTWRVLSLQLALNIEHSLPFLPRLQHRMGLMQNNIKFDVARRRWIMTIKSSKRRRDNMTKAAEEDSSTSAFAAVTKAIGKLQGKVEQLNSAHLEVTKDVQMLSRKIGSAVTDIEGVGAVATVSASGGPTVPEPGRQRRRSSVAVYPTRRP